MKQPVLEIPLIDDLHLLKPDDYNLGRKMLGEAFREDPVWKEIMKGQEHKFQYVFETPIKYALKYGAAYAPDKNITAIAGWLPTPYVDITFWRAVRSGSLSVAPKLGLKLGLKIKKIFEQITKDRQEYMKGQYLYLIVLGVSPEKQGQGFGSRLVKKMQDNLPNNIPIYLETESERNVRFYERLGFEVIKKIEVPLDPPKPMWEMVYRP